MGCVFSSGAEADGATKQRSVPAARGGGAQGRGGASRNGVVGSEDRSGDNSQGEKAMSASWSRLNPQELAAVQHTLLKVSELIGRFTEGSSDREAPVHALRKALHLIAADCKASYASLTLLSSDQSHYMTIGAVGSCTAAVSQPVIAHPLPPSGSSLDAALVAAAAAAAASSSSGNGPGGGNGSSAALSASAGQIVTWRAPETGERGDRGGGGGNGGQPPPVDWRPLAKAGLRALHGVAIRGGPKDQLLGMLNVGYTNPADQEVKGAMFTTYLNLVGATITAVAKDATLQLYLAVARELQMARSLDCAVQAALQQGRTVLRGRGPGGGGGGSHLWLRMALISTDKSAAVLFDDLTQSAAVRGHKRPTATSSFSGSFTMVQRIQAAGGLLRTNIPMRSTILRIALTNKKQVLIPDVQKLINQLGAVNTDLFASRHVRPPTSVLLLPLRASGTGIYGAMYCLSDVQTEFTEVSGYLKEVADLVGGGLMRLLAGELATEYAPVQGLSEDAIMSPDTKLDDSSADGIPGAYGHSTPGGPGSGGPSSGGGAPGGGGQSNASLPHAAGASGGTHSRGTGGSDWGGRGGAVGADGYELGSTMSTAGGSLVSGGSFTGGASFVGPTGRSFTARQSASSTGALVTGLTEKLNQRRLEAAMHDTEGGDLRDLQLTAQIGEGGFARVFRGLWRGQVVAVKVVASGEPGNERAVMKNAHEIAILSALSHPNILQAYTCLTDVMVRDVLAVCIRLPSPQARSELAANLTAGGANGCGTGDAAACHIEVIEYCDLGNLTHAIRNNVFRLPACPEDALLPADAAGGFPVDPSGAAAAVAAADPHGFAGGLVGSLDGGAASSHGQRGAAAEGPREPLRVNLTTLLLTLLEVAGGMSYLHRMGVVHCDLKPANVLLKSSTIDRRGFTAKISDFGLSRVEDDETCATFPFNSCGTAAYVAPEALVSSKKVNSSVDVYAFGIIMWELLTGQRPYGNMKQQKVVEEVVLRGLRPRFPRGTPPAYEALAAACWSAQPQQRPPFTQVIGQLQSMLSSAEEAEAAAAASCSLLMGEGWSSSDGAASGIGPGSLVAAGAAAAAARSARASFDAGNGSGVHPQGSAAGDAAAAAVAAAAAAVQQQQGAQQQRRPYQRSFSSIGPSGSVVRQHLIEDVETAWNRVLAGQGGGPAAAAHMQAARQAAAFSAAHYAAQHGGGYSSAGRLQQLQMQIQAAQQQQQQQQQAAAAAAAVQQQQQQRRLPQRRSTFAAPGTYGYGPLLQPQQQQQQQQALLALQLQQQVLQQQQALQQQQQQQQAALAAQQQQTQQQQTQQLQQQRQASLGRAASGGPGGPAALTPQADRPHAHARAQLAQDAIAAAAAAAAAAGGGYIGASPAASPPQVVPLTASQFAERQLSANAALAGGPYPMDGAAALSAAAAGGGAGGGAVHLSGGPGARGSGPGASLSGASPPTGGGGGPFDAEALVGSFGAQPARRSDSFASRQALARQAVAAAAAAHAAQQQQQWGQQGDASGGGGPV